ncbi:MAG: hypothetical protein CVT80_07615 [Alphaproteobacteria bacterium HGW-Alphaproteobacteria-2]|nr:MAG: hypothetical protein CVT80_07615 [Alphaproteobacteria bacterium HGW-Alphaproteobacteria-2]
MLLASALMFVALVGAVPAQEVRERVIVGLSQNRISITANFDGSEVLIFGAVHREAPPPAVGPLEVIITVTGPSQPVTVRRKSRVAGIWVNTDAVAVERAPSFYAVATTAPLETILTGPEDHRFGISVARRIRAVSAPEDMEDRDAFIEALLRVRAAEGLYQTVENSVELREETLFRARVALPANLVEGDYQTRIFILRDQRVIDAETSIVSVRKVGLERWLHQLAQERPLHYGLLAVFIAVLAGWGAAFVFARLRA